SSGDLPALVPGAFSPDPPLASGATFASGAFPSPEVLVSAEALVSPGAGGAAVSSDLVSVELSALALGAGPTIESLSSVGRLSLSNTFGLVGAPALRTCRA